MSYRGDIALGATIDIKFTTRRFSSGAPYAWAGSPAVACYVDNGTTEITAGITLTNDFDSRTGLHNVRIVASSGNGYAAGTNVDVVVTSGTVDSVSIVGEVVGSFSIEARSGLRPATAGRTLVVDASGLADANVVKMGPTGSGAAQTARDIGASVLLSSGTGTGQLSLSSGAVLLQATQTGVTIPTVTTLTNAPSDSSGVTTLLGKFTGITLLAQWLGLIAGKQTGNSTARTELRATGAGSGTFDETTDSVEAIRDRGDAAWTGGGGGGGGPTAEEIAVEVLDTQDIETGVSLRQSIRGQNAVLMGKASGMGTSNGKFRNLADTKDVIDATQDVDGNRTAVTRDLT
jgi:hypothetical protein